MAGAGHRRGLRQARKVTVPNPQEKAAQANAEAQRKTLCASTLSHLPHRPVACKYSFLKRMQLALHTKNAAGEKKTDMSFRILDFIRTFIGS